MRRKDREINDLNEIVEKIIDKSDVIRIGLADGDYPYIVPLNYGYSFNNGELEFYVHGAKAGRKMDLIRKNPVCSFEIDTAHKPVFIKDKKYATMNFESAMGRGKIEIIDNEQEKIRMLDSLTERYEPPEGFVYNPKSVPVTEVMKIVVTEITGKANRKKA
ncbi:MAG: pyridoxamine 5'-phosphate oxidase family protein [Eubacteriales bacterium]|nr:pyridoxamine 5'-phosphate oxidase family protein [Eubacteriales bacterium]